MLASFRQGTNQERVSKTGSFSGEDGIDKLLLGTSEGLDSSDRVSIQMDCAIGAVFCLCELDGATVKMYLRPWAAVLFRKAHNRPMRRILNQAANAAVKRKGSIFEIVYRRLVPRLGHNKNNRRNCASHLSLNLDSFA
jgi:hypothetical protein